MTIKANTHLSGNRQSEERIQGSGVWRHLERSGFGTPISLFDTPISNFSTLNQVGKRKWRKVETVSGRMVGEAGEES
jgi:hypothetical protein